MKSELLKRSHKRMYKDDVIFLKEALIVIMPTLEVSSQSLCEEEGNSTDSTPTFDSHFCKTTHKLVKRFKAQHGFEPADGIVDLEIWDKIMSKSKAKA